MYTCMQCMIKLMYTRTALFLQQGVYVKYALSPGCTRFAEFTEVNKYSTIHKWIYIKIYAIHHNHTENIILVRRINWSMFALAYGLSIYAVYVYLHCYPHRARIAVDEQHWNHIIIYFISIIHEIYSYTLQH